MSMQESLILARQHQGMDCHVHARVPNPGKTASRNGLPCQCKKISRIRQYYAGMKINYVGDEEMIFCYGERNRPQANKPSIVFVHGFSSSKDQWISCFKFFKGFLTLRLPKMEFYLRLFKAITTEENFDLLANIAHEIVVPSQLIWGKQDELIHVSGADVLSARLPNCYYVDIIDNCGHAVDLDRPGTLNKHLLKFIREDCCKEINTKKSD
nr:monoacylglycerol lipase ABHD6-like [Biomphalaria glabrata]